MRRRRKKSGVRVIHHKQKIIWPKPDCPRCHKGFLKYMEYVQVATEDWEEQRARVQYYPRCEWIF